MNRKETWESLPLLLDSMQVAIILGVAQRTVCRWAREHKVCANKIGKKYLFERDAIMQIFKGEQEK